VRHAAQFAEFQIPAARRHAVPFETMRDQSDGFEIIYKMRLIEKPRRLRSCKWNDDQRLSAPNDSQHRAGSDTENLFGIIEVYLSPSIT